MKKLTSFVLAAAMTIGCGMFTACSSRPEPELSRVTHVYKSTDVELPDNLSISSIHPVPIDGQLILRAREVVSEDPYETRDLLLKLDIETGEYVTEEVPTLGENIYVNFIIPMEDGCYIYVSNVYDEEKGTEQYRMDKVVNGEFTTICEDMEALFAVKAEESEYGFGDFYVQNIQLDSEGNIFVATDSVIGVFDSEMKKQFEIELTGWFGDMGASADGRVYASFYDRQNGEYALKYIDVASRGFGENVSTPNIANISNYEFYIGPGYDLYYNDESSVWGYSEGGEPVELLNWINSDIIESGIQDLVVIDENRFVANYYERREEGSIRELYVLERIPDEEVPERYVIDLAVRYIDYNLPGQIVKFNRASDTYRVRLTDYSVYSTKEDRQLPETTLYNEISAGMAPDIIALSNFTNRTTLLEENIFLDLYEFMDEDESFDKSQLFNSVLTPFERNGELNELVTTMSLQTLVGKKANVPYESWTVAQFLDWAESLSADQYIFNYTGQQQMLNTLLCASFGEFIDIEAGKVDFDNETFRRLLEFAKNTATFNYDQSLSGDALADYQEDRNRIYREDVMMLDEAYIFDVSSVISSMFTFGFEDVTFVGYPGTGSGVMVYPSSSYAIVEDSPVAEGAWEFLKSILQNTDLSRGGREISSLRSVTRAMAEENMKMHYFYRYDGGTSGSTSESFLTRYNESQGIYRDITIEDVELMERLIDNATAVPSYADKALEIIMEEVEMYFAGDKDLDATVDIIENRVGLYIAENS